MIQLKRFTRLMIKVGETKHVVFNLTYDDFSIIDRKMNKIIEPGIIKIMVGKSSDNIVLQDKIEIQNI